MEPIRVLIADMRPMLRDIVSAAFAVEPDLLLLAEPLSADALAGTPAAGLVERLHAHGADVVVVGVPKLDALHAYDVLLYAMSSLCVLGVTLDGQRAAVARLTPRHDAVVDVSAQGLVDALREAIQATRARKRTLMAAGAQPDTGGSHA